MQDAPSCPRAGVYRTYTTPESQRQPERIEPMTTPTPPSPEKRALIDAYETALKASAEQREAEQRAGAKRPRRTRPIAWVVLALALAGTGIAAMTRPAWLGIRRPLAEPPAVREASLRLAVALEAQRVLRFQRENGRLPATLEEAGGAMPGITYQRSREGIYELNAADGDVAVIYRSTSSLRTFVGNSYEVVSRRGK